MIQRHDKMVAAKGLRPFLMGGDDMEEYVFWAITGGIGLLGSIVTYLLKREIDKSDKRIAQNEARTREVEGKLNKTIADLPFAYTLREDFIRVTANHDRKLDQIIALLSANHPKGGTKDD